MADTLVFLHANGFPSGSYRRFLGALEGFASVVAPEVIDTPHAMRASQRWPEMTRRVVDLVREVADRAGPVVLVGHSMGGYLSLMAADRLSDRVRAIVLVDSPIVTGWRKSVFEALRVSGLTTRGGPAPVAARRRHQWSSRDEAREHFSPKAFVRDWAPGVLEDFLAHGLAGGPGGPVSLRIAREAERDIYAHVPTHRVLRAFRRLRAAGCPIDMIAGASSREMSLAGREGNRRLFGERWHELPTGHLVPLEQPLACAAKVARCLGLADARLDAVESIAV